MSTTKDGLTRLLEKQQEEIYNIDKKTKLWTNYKEDYLQLKKLINTMTDKVRHPFDIPVAGSKLALVRGHIIHTNEITVLLGDNYFALRSAKQANEIIDRRLANINDMLQKSQEARHKAEEWLKATTERKQEKEEFVEIIETM